MSKEKSRQPALSTKMKKDVLESNEEIIFPITPAKVLELYGNKLNDSEKDEISTLKIFII